MSAPFLIWTMRRTGGTTLAALLTTLSEHPGIQHEPFNAERKLGAVTTRWREGRDPARLRSDIETSLAHRPVLKHCHELMPPELNRTLMEVANDLGYRHIVLDRRAEADRILSLELAKLTGAWGGKDAKRIYTEIEAGEVSLPSLNIEEAVAHLRFCRKRRSEVRDLFATTGQQPHVIYFEDIYHDPDAGRTRVGALLEFLGIEPDDHPEYEKQLTEALLHRGQNSARIMSAIPNITAARRALDMAHAAQAEVFAAS